ncbi:MAG: hypothetical protein IT306_03475 [Chloroflexi bacterium]|nr:hypothetical protein [Chloroflexota bacterium]
MDSAAGSEDIRAIDAVAPPALAAAADPPPPDLRARPVAAHRTAILAHLLFLVTALGLFRLSVFGGWTFVGDSDRLNTVLNVRAFELASLAARGSVPTWSEQQFMGASIVGLHWLLAGATPLPRILALLGSAEVYHALAVLAALMLFAAMSAAYWLLGAYTTSVVGRIVGALLYGTGSYLIHKLTQLDLSFLAMVAPPLLLGLVRRGDGSRAAWTFLAMTGIWSFLVLFTILQEVAYVGLLWGTYALYRSVRLRTRWPVLLGGLAFVCGVILGTPRVITIAAEIPFVVRTSENLQTTSIEGLRYFGDGLLGRSQGEQNALRGQRINTHEGVQLLSSEGAAVVVLGFGLLGATVSRRAWAVALLVVVSVGVNLYFRPFYEMQSLGLRGLAFPSRELRTVVVNAVLLGLPAWLLSWWLARRRADTAQTEHRPADRVPGDDDVPFFLGFATLGLAAILIPEARLLLYHGFMRMDFLHSRISVAMTLPLAILATMALNALLPRRPCLRDTRLLTIGLLLGGALWAARELVALVAAQSLGPILTGARPQQLVTEEVVRVLTSAVVVVVAMAGVVAAVRGGRPALPLLGGLLAVWMGLETVAMTDHRLNGPQVTRQPRPFAELNYLQVAPREMQLPSAAQRATLQARLEVSQYRSVLIQDREQFLALPEPHLSGFWDLRLVEGYSTGVPRRLAALPWEESMVDAHHLDLYQAHSFYGLPWRLLAALNVKYAVVVDRSLWFNPAPGGRTPPLDPARLTIVENPFPVTPRAFFAARVRPAGEPVRFPGDTGRRPAPRDPPVTDPATLTVVEGWNAERAFATEGTVDARFDGDRVSVRLTPLGEDRFLVLNELYHPAWHARVDGQPAQVSAANLVMRGILVPAGATTVELEYVPFLKTAAATAIYAFGVAASAAIFGGLLLVAGRPGRRRSGASRSDGVSRSSGFGRSGAGDAVSRSGADGSSASRPAAARPAP